MGLAFLIKQNVTWLDVAMQNAVIMCVVHGACYFGDEFYRVPDWHWLALDYFIELAAFDEFHAEVARAVALTYFVNWDNRGMLKTGDRFGFPTKAFHVRFGGPRAKADHLQRNGAIETFLSRTI